MQSSDIPDKFNIPFGNSAGGSYIRPIPENSQIGINDGWASLTDGFVPLNATPPESGGIPPFMQDMNGILKQISAWSRWVGAGGPVRYDRTFQAAVGGYPKGATVQSAVSDGVWWISLAENNVTNPDSGGAGWYKHKLITSGSTPTAYWRKESDGFIRQWGYALTGVLPNGASAIWTSALPVTFQMLGASATLGNGGVGTGSAVTVMDIGTPYTGASDTVLPAATASQISGFVQNNSTFATKMLIRWECWGREI